MRMRSAILGIMLAIFTVMIHLCLLYSLADTNIVSAMMSPGSHTAFFSAILAILFLATRLMAIFLAPGIMALCLASLLLHKKGGA
jgi:hypothetical protein